MRERHYHGTTKRKTEIHGKTSKNQKADDAEQGINRLCFLRHDGVNGIHTDVLIHFDTIADTNIDQPNEHISGQFFCPGQRVVECVAEEHLNDDEDTHCRQEDDAQDFFNVFIKKTQYLHVEFNLLLEKSYLFSLSYKKLWNGAAANAAAPFFLIVQRVIYWES